MRISPEEMTRPQRLAQNFLPEMVQRGISGAQALGELRSADIGYRTQNFYRDWNWWQEASKEWSNLRYVPDEFSPGERFYVQTGYKRPSKFSTVFRIDYRDVDTGELRSVHRTVHHTHIEAGREVSDKALTKSMGRLKQDAAQTFETGSPEAGAEFVGAVPEQGWESI